MGFVIHKYFLSKGLKAPPPPEDKKKKKQKNQQRYSQPASSKGYATTPEFLTVPESAYASNNTNNGNSASYGLSSTIMPPRQRYRRNSMSTTTYRRASMPMNSSGMMMDGGNEYQDGSSTSYNASLSFVRQHSYRRASLQHDSIYRQEEKDYFQPGGGNNHATNHQQKVYADYYQLEDTKDDMPSYVATSDWEQDNGNHKAPRRASISSEASSVGTNTHQSTGGGDGFATSSNSRLKQENKWLQVQLRQLQRHYTQLEYKLYGARDQLAYSNASWLDQLYDARSKHQQEVFQTQRQAEQAANSILEQEMEELKSTLLQVAHEQAKLDECRKAKKEEEQQESENEDDNDEEDGMDKEEEYYVKKSHGADAETWKKRQANVSKLLAEAKKWKKRHALATANAKRIQDILEQEAVERTALLQESERRVAWLEEELQTAVPEMDVDDEDEEDEDEAAARYRRHLSLLRRQQSELEQHVQELLMENAQLQRGQTESYELQTRVKELEGALAKAKNELEQHQTRHAGRDVTSATEDTFLMDGASSSFSIHEGTTHREHPSTALLLQQAQEREKELLREIQRLQERESSSKEQTLQANERIEALANSLNQDDKDIFASLPEDLM